MYLNANIYMYTTLTCIYKNNALLICLHIFWIGSRHQRSYQYERRWYQSSVHRKTSALLWLFADAELLACRQMPLIHNQLTIISGGFCAAQPAGHLGQNKEREHVVGTHHHGPDLFTDFCFHHWCTHDPANRLPPEAFTSKKHKELISRGVPAIACLETNLYWPASALWPVLATGICGPILEDVRLEAAAAQTLQRKLVRSTLDWWCSGIAVHNSGSLDEVQKSLVEVGQWWQSLSDLSHHKPWSIPCCHGSFHIIPGKPYQ